MKIPKAKKLKSGTWYIQLRLAGQSIYITANTEKECVRKAELIKAEHRSGLCEASASLVPTLDEALSLYIDSRRNVLSASTVAGYEAIRRTRFLSYGNTRIDRINWQRMVNGEAVVCSAKTLRNAFALVCAAVVYAGLKKPQATLPQIVRNEHPFLSAEQIPVFLEAVKGKPVELAALLGLHSLRRSEIAGLTWENVDLKKQVIHVHGALVKNDKNEFVRQQANKNTFSRRTVPIMIPRLAELLDAVPPEERTGPVIREHPNSIWKAVNKVCRDAGLPEIGTHGLRHSFASAAYRAGLEPLEMMRLGGWNDTTTMHKIYTHIADAEMTAAANKLSSFYSPEK